MSLKYAILSMVSSQPQSGYDIAKDFSTSVNFYWEASHQQIYKTLAELERKQWLDMERVEQPGKPDKKNYSITLLGKQALLDWAGEPTKPMPRKNALLVKLLAIEEVGSAVLTKELKRYQHVTQEKLNIYRQIESDFFKQGIEGIDCLLGLGKFLALRKGIHFSEGELQWLAETLDALEPLSEPG